jgi:hypothetical protein
MKKDSNHYINRRQFIKKSAIGVLGAGALLTAGKMIVSTPDMELIDPYPELQNRRPVIPPYNKKALFFSEHQYALVATLAALIIPTDDDPGATEAGVVDYIDSLVARSKEKQAIYAKGLKWLDELSEDRHGSGKEFLRLSLKEQVNLLRLIDAAHSMRWRRITSFWQRVDRKIDKILDDLFGAGNNSRFFNVVRRDAFRGYYTSPVSWQVVGYFGPPQPVGYLDFSDPPSSAYYSGSVRPIRNRTCLICHEDTMTHPKGGLINHTCTNCHRPHSPWPYDKDTFHLEDHIGFLFPNPDEKKGGS